LGLFLCGVHCELEVPIFKSHLHSSPFNHLRLKVASLFLGRVNVRQIALEAEFRDIRVAVLFLVVSGFLAGFVVVCFLHIRVYFSAHLYIGFVR